MPTLLWQCTRNLLQLPYEPYGKLVRLTPATRLGAHVPVALYESTLQPPESLWVHRPTEPRQSHDDAIGQAPKGVPRQCVSQRIPSCAQEQLAQLSAMCHETQLWEHPSYYHSMSHRVWGFSGFRFSCDAGPVQMQCCVVRCSAGEQLSWGGCCTRSDNLTTRRVVCCVPYHAGDGFASSAVLCASQDNLSLFRSQLP